MSSKDEKNPISLVALADFLANLERAGLITVNREKLKLP
jgi:DNA-binding IscR family transcriptional regulator